MSAEVWCYAGHKYPERPTAFLWEGQKLKVSKVQSTWKTEDAENFLVHTTCGREFLLSFKTANDTWEVREMDKIDG